MRSNVGLRASVVAALLVLVTWVNGPATAETLIRTAATSSSVFPVPVPGATLHDASPMRTADNGCPCHDGCIRILHTCKAMGEPNCYRDEQKCWLVCNKNHPECRRD